MIIKQVSALSNWPSNVVLSNFLFVATPLLNESLSGYGDKYHNGRYCLPLHSRYPYQLGYDFPEVKRRLTLTDLNGKNRIAARLTHSRLFVTDGRCFLTSLQWLLFSDLRHALL